MCYKECYYNVADEFVPGVPLLPPPPLCLNLYLLKPCTLFRPVKVSEKHSKVSVDVLVVIVVYADTRFREFLRGN